MSTFVYGPQAGGAGVRVFRRDASIPSMPGAFGSSVAIGAFRKGPVGVVLHQGGADDVNRVRKDDLIVEDPTPLAVRHFFDAGKGSGVLATLRVTDGNERAASLRLFDRYVDTTVRALAPDTRTNGTVGQLDAASPGTWAGKGLEYGGSVADGAAAETGPTFATGSIAFAKDELKGGVFTLTGHTREWAITGNTAVGVVTVQGDFVAEALAAVPIRWHVSVPSVRYDGTKSDLTVRLRDGSQNPDLSFGVVLSEDGGEYSLPKLLELSLDSDDTRHWQKTIDELLRQHEQWEVDAADVFAGDPVLAHLKPANFAEIPFPGGVSGNTVKLETFRYKRTGTGEGYIARTAFTVGSAVKPHYLVLTFTDATHYTVEAYDFNDMAIAEDLPAGEVAVAYGPPEPHLSGHTVTAAGAAHVEGDTITIFCRVLPTDLKARKAWLYPNAFASTHTGSKDVTQRFRVTKVTQNADGSQTLTLGLNDDLAGIAVPPGLPQAVGTTSGTYANNAIKTVMCSLEVDGVISGVAINVSTAGTGGATDTATQEAAAINAALAAEPRVEAFVHTDDAGLEYVGLRATAAWGNYGPNASIVVDKDGTINTIIGFSAAADTEEEGENPTTCRVEYEQPLTGGIDGHHDLADEDYTSSAFDLEDSPLLDLPQYNLGLITLFAPGQYGGDIQDAAQAFCERHGFWWNGTVQSTITTEQSAGKWQRDNLSSFLEHGWLTFPSYCDLADNPFGGSTAYQADMMGLITGLEANLSVRRKGYQKAPAGADLRLDGWVRRLTTDATDDPNPMNDAILNGYGIRTIMHQGSSIYLFGDEAPGLNGKGTIWVHKAKSILHLVAEIRANMYQYVYEVVDDDLRKKVVSALRSIFRPHHKDGWFKGTGEFDSDVQIVANDTNNPPEVQALGKVVATCTFEIVETAKVVEVVLGTKGMAVRAAA